jgi:hypothetical protein
MPRYTEKQGQYLAFIYYYTKIHGRPPSEAEIQGYFGVTPPTVHQNGAVSRKERADCTRRWPGAVNQAVITEA